MVRLRFAPSPTGPLHIGGVRTALYNYLFARKMGGKFILRIEDTDQTRYVPGAEAYIIEALKWFGIETDENPEIGGDYGPYRQSERKDIYKKYTDILLEKGHAYYAFDSAEELEAKRAEVMASGKHSFKYDASARMEMRNSLSLESDEVAKLIEQGDNLVIRLKIPTDEVIGFDDIVRDHVKFSSNELDDKVIMKGDGMPTYHLANIVDDHLMEISHVIRGEEWLSSTAHHVLMYRMMGWTPPKYAHLPLILKPVGKGKLSKRDGAKFGFPVFPLQWSVEGEDDFQGFREEGYDPDAILNFLSFLGWNPGTEQEMFSMEGLIEAFSLEKIVKSGARFDIDKAKWYNQQYIMGKDNKDIAEILQPMLAEKGYTYKDENYLLSFIEQMKERVETYPEFLSSGYFYFQRPGIDDEKTAKKKWKADNEFHFDAIKKALQDTEDFSTEKLQEIVKGYITGNELSFGAIFPILRIITSGTMKGPDLFDMMALLGKEEVLARYEAGIEAIKGLV